MRTCSKCGNEHGRNGAYCCSCHAAYMREWRKTHPLNEDQRKRDSARSYAQEYKKRGKIKPQPCNICGSEKSQMHHPDHELPLLIAWLCRECHLAWHAHWRLISLRTWNRWLASAKNVQRETIRKDAA